MSESNEAKGVPLNQIVTLNVGGTMFLSSRATLSQSPLLKRAIDSNNGYQTLVIDRDPDTFADILAALRGYPTLKYIDTAYRRAQLVIDINFFELGTLFNDIDVGQSGNK